MSLIRHRLTDIRFLRLAVRSEFATFLQEERVRILMTVLHLRVK